MLRDNSATNASAAIKIAVPDITAFQSAIYRAIKTGEKVACIECGSIFENDDLAFTLETGECQYCHQRVSEIWLTKGRREVEATQ